MKPFEYQHPGEIVFGNGRISEVGSLVSRYGRRCLVVSGPKDGALRDLYPIVGDLLEHLEITWEHFDGVRPNPTVDLVSNGAKIAKQFAADVVLGIGGGSSLDTAKAIAVEATHAGTSWDYLFFYSHSPFASHHSPRYTSHGSGILKHFANFALASDRLGNT